MGVCRAAAGKAAGQQKPGGCPLLGSPVGWPLGSPRQEVTTHGHLGPISVSGSSLPSLELSARHLSCVMGKQRGAPAGEGCWIPAGAKAASGRDGERAVACARHGGRDAPLGLRAAFLMESRAPAAPESGLSRADGIRGIPCRCATPTTKNHFSHPHPVCWQGHRAPLCPLSVRFPPLGWTDAARAGRGHRVPPAHG